jgi:hypothetical protein
LKRITFNARHNYKHYREYQDDEILGETGNIMVIERYPDSGYDRDLLVIDSSFNLVIAHIILTEVGDNIFTPIYVAVSNLYRGNNLMPIAYHIIMRTTKCVLMAGKDQSTGGRHIWYSMAKRYKSIQMFAMKNRRATEAHHVWADEDTREVSSDFDLYSKTNAVLLAYHK